MDKLVWHTEQRRINDLIPWEDNPRQMTEKQAHDLRRSLESLNLMSIPVIDTDNKIVSGHQRMKIMQLLGRGGETIDVRIPNRKLTDAEFLEANLRENKNLGEWDYDMLANFDSEMLEDIGWTKDELEYIFQTNDKESIDEDNYKIPEEIKTNIIQGDIIQLGNHRLMCGDATNRDDIEKLMNDEKANIVFTDPPYGVNYADKNKFLNLIDKENRNQKKIIQDNINEKEINIFWKKSFEIIRDNLSEINSYYITGPQIHGMMMMMMQEAGLPYRHVIIWVKNNHVLGRCDYNYKHEPIFFGWTTKHKFYGKGEFLTSVWEVDKPLKNDLHPTMKPVKLIKNALLNSSEKNQICLDPFGGSGSTLIACEELNRNCYMMEIDPEYCEIICQRWELLTGKKRNNLCHRRNETESR